MPRAAVFSGPGNPLVLRDVDRPVLRDGEALVEILLCTLCASDLHTYSGRRETPCPTVLGHEILGRVLECSPTIRTDASDQPIEIGDRVTWGITASCGRCFFCEHELPQKCERLFKYGHEAISDAHTLSGGLATHCVLAAGTALYRVPPAIPDVVACPANCATATVAAALRVGEAGRARTVVVHGAGMLGLTASAMARELGAEEVIVTDVRPERLTLASDFGATRTVDVRVGSEAVRDLVDELTEERGVDLALEFSGSNAAVLDAIDLARTGGHVVLVGSVLPAPDVPVSAERLVRGCLHVHGVHNYRPDDLGSALEFLERSWERFPFSSLVAREFSLDEVTSAFAAASEGDVLRVAVRP